MKDLKSKLNKNFTEIITECDGANKGLVIYSSGTGGATADNY
jgi:hypothetical protein